MEDNKLIIKRSKEFPYSVYEGKDKDTYIVEFIDGNGKQIREEIKADICIYFNEHIHKLYSQEYKIRKYLEWSLIYENNIVKRAFEKEESIEDKYIKAEEYQNLRNALNLIPETQRRRIKKYFFENKKETEIAEEEGVEQSSVSESIHLGIYNLKKILKNF